MKPLKAWTKKADRYFAQRNVVAFDLDDTLTHQGSLPAAVVEALEAVQKKNYLTVLVTGRSAGWVHALIRLMPFDAIVGENGALLAFWPKRKNKRGPQEEATKLYWTPTGYQSEPPTHLKPQLDRAAQTLLKKFPQTRLASDQSFRIYDLAIDFAEEVSPPLSFAEAELIRQEFAKLGATAKVSSIHVNGWWGNFSKVDGLKELLEKHYQKSLEKNVIYVGDSPNDSPLFKAAGLSIGVANVQQFVGRADLVEPQFITKKESAHGALEILTLLRRTRRKL